VEGFPEPDRGHGQARPLRSCSGRAECAADFSSRHGLDAGCGPRRLSVQPGALYPCAWACAGHLAPGLGAARGDRDRDPPRQPERQALREARGGGQVEQAFGFELTPLVARAAEFQCLADEVRVEAKARVLLREEVSLHRRDIAKTIAIAFEEELQGPWRELADRFALLGGMPPRSAGYEALSELVLQLRALRLDADKCLTDAVKSEELTSSESQTERHQQNSKTDTLLESGGFCEVAGL